MTVALVETAALRVRQSTLLPALGRPERVLDRVLSGVGLTCATWAFAASLLPSLLPRTPWLQGIVSGVTVAVGYGLGSGGAALWRYLGIPGLAGRTRMAVLGILVGLGQWAALWTGWRLVGWQNEIRQTFGMEPTSPLIWPVVITVTVLVATALLLAGRGIRLLSRTAVAWLGRRLPPRLSIVLGTGLVVLLFWGLWTGVMVNGFFAAANAIFAPRDTTGSHSTDRPTAPERSGSAESLAAWQDLGYYGRIFVRGGPSAARIEEVTGRPGAKEPIRVYAGLQSADTVQERADLVLAELKRTGAFERRVLVVATTTGMGFLDSRGTDPLEYLWNGDTAIAGVQYSFLPSWISLLADQEAVVETSRTVFETIRQHWATLPEAERPALYLYGLSLGSMGVESVLTSMNIVNEPVDGAFMVGPPFVNDLHPRLDETATPAPRHPSPSTRGDARCASRRGAASSATRVTWGPTRVAYLQHASDPVVFFSSDLAFERPQWLADGQRGRDVSPTMGWVPLVTMWQVLLDMPSAGEVPTGYGHMYSARANMEGWAAVTQPPGWSEAMSARIGAALGGS